MPTHSPFRQLPRIALLASFLSGCDSTPEPSVSSTDRGTGPPRLSPAGQVAVQETDSLFLSSPGDFGLEPSDGSYYVTDQFAGRVLQIARDGRIVRTFGRKGSGPGEFAQINLMFSRGDEIFVHEGRQGVFQVFDRHTGEYLTGHRQEGIFRDVRLMGNTAWLGMQNVARGTSVARWDLGTGRVDYLVPLPGEYRESQPLSGIYNSVFVLPWADSLIVGFQGHDDLYVATSAGNVVDTIKLPVRARRGVPDQFGQKMKKMQWPEMIAGASALFAMGRLPDGRVAAAHLDQEVTGSLFTADGYLTVLSADRRSACVDGKIPLNDDTSPRMLFRGDTLFVLQQRLVGDARAETTIAQFVIDTHGCEWTPVAR